MKNLISIATFQCRRYWYHFSILWCLVSVGTHLCNHVCVFYAFPWHNIHARLLLFLWALTLDRLIPPPPSILPLSLMNCVSPLTLHLQMLPLSDFWSQISWFGCTSAFFFDAGGQAIAGHEKPPKIFAFGFWISAFRCFFFFNREGNATVSSIGSKE